MADGKDVYRYEVLPINFLNLSVEKQGEVVDRFHQFLNSLNRRIRLLITRGTQNVDVGSEKYPMQFYRFFIESHGEPLDTQLSTFRLLYQPMLNTPSIDVVKVFPSKLALYGGVLTKSYTIYKLPGQLPEGFISETYGAVDRVSIEFTPIPHDQATAKMSRYVRFLRGTVLSHQQKERMLDEEFRARYEMAEDLLKNVVAGVTRLFEVRTVFTASGKNSGELQGNAKILKDTLRSRLIYLDSPRFIQYPLSLGREGKKLIMDTVSAGTLFPFVSVDVIELPNGVVLGANRLTGSPIIYDIYLHDNYNVSILGVTGSGKSMAGKILLTRMLQRNPEMPFYVIDPENEYVKLGELLGAHVVEIQRGMPLGLDPLVGFDSSTASEILIEASKLPESHQGRLRTLAYKHRTLEELYANAPKEIRRYLENLIEGPQAYIFKGEPLEFYDKMILSLKSVSSSITSEEMNDQQIISLLLFGKIWDILNDETLLPREAEKMVIVDEAWIYMAIRAAANFLNHVSRRSRKRNTCLVTLTQRPADVLGESRDKPGPGRTVVEMSSTKMLLRQDETSANIVVEAFGLSEAEREELVEFQPGQGLLIAENLHVPVQFIASKEEYEVFTTRPSDLA